MKQRDFTSARAKEALLKDKDKFCGECCWFYAEDTDGYGLCPLALMESKRCDEPCTNGEFVSKEEMRHHMAVLLQANRYRRDDNVPSIYRMPDQKELGLAIDFAYRYMKIFGEL
jgi:hypothetical protein